MANHIHIEITGEKQGPFHGDDPSGKAGPSRCHGLHFTAKKNNDHGRASTNSGTASSNDPIEVHKPFGPSTPQLCQAFWTGETLSTVKITTFYADGTGATDKPFQVITLSNSTIAELEQEVRDHLSESTGTAASTNSGETAGFTGTNRIKFTYEQITVEHPAAKTKTKHGLPSNKLGLPSVPGMPNL